MSLNWNNKNEVIEVVKRNGRSLEHASYELQNDKELVLIAVKDNGWSLEHASDELKNDKEVVLEAVKNSGWSLKYASDELKNDKEVVLEAVKRDGRSLRYASDDLINDKEVILEAVNQESYALEYASEEIKKLVGDNDPIEFLKYEIAEKLKNELPKQDDFRNIIDSKQIQELHALILEKNKSVEIPDAYISATSKPKEEVKSQSQVEESNHQPVVAQQPIKQRGMKL